MDKSTSPLTKTLITEPTLFITNVPSFIKEDDLKNAFKDFDFDITRVVINAVRSRSTNDTNWRHGARKGQVAQVDFSSIEDGTSWQSGVVIYTSISDVLEPAEKALATLHLRPLPKTIPSVLLCFSTTSECIPLLTFISGNPRLVKLLPQGFTDATLYDLIRPFGPLASVRVDEELGGMVQFWSEADAQAAEQAVRQTFASTSKITLKVYDPCNLYCAVCLQLPTMASRLMIMLESEPRNRRR
jgi:hypothetical protein